MRVNVKKQFNGDFKHRKPFCADVYIRVEINFFIADIKRLIKKSSQQR